ncbi:ABC transporter substrate-binding protein [Roseomonas aerophila]|uniref:ABC transporter substrate-binding protein n=1 Tax=Teichococcus aerophilus TaxID=1224513 RepID=A0ABR7RR33_9PROT|nr:ABC transporter substrate-binding protein [Pseudoroseomonas aerophila]MBC9208615.1 ABC transporter substrate-binding protein [Pseudoroseomonas aerophila]
MSLPLTRRTLLAGGAALASSGLARPHFAHAQGGGGNRGTLRFIPSTPLPSLDPIVATSYVIRNHGYLIYDTLFATDANFQIKPQMVREWQTAPDGLTWTFHLRDGLAFHDGQPVRAQDCIASIQRWSKRDAFGQTFATFVEGYAADDARTFSIRLKKPFPLLPDALGKLSSNVPFIMPERVAQGDASKPISDPTGSGPWQFQSREWVPGQNAIYTRNATYKPREEAPSWAAGGKVAKIDRIEWLALTEPSAAVGALLQGEVDWYEQPPVDLLPVLKRDRNIAIQNVPLGLILLMRFNQAQPPFNNPGVRRAVLMAMKQEDYMQAVVGSPDYYREAKTFFTPGSPMSTGAGGQEAMRGDLERAKAMLKEAGYANEKVVLLAPADQPIAYNQSLVTQELLKNLGMNVELISTDWASFIGRRSNRGLPDAGGWSVFHTLWSGADVLNPALHPLIRSNGATAWFGWPEDATLEGLRDQWIATADTARQKELAAQIERRAFETVPYAPAGLIEQPMAYRTSLKGMVVSPVQFFWNMEKTG